MTEPLPVPRLRDTLDRYLRSLEPLAADDPAALVRAREQAAALERDGQHLQAALERRAATHANWLEEWWNELAYLKWPNAIYPQEGVSLRADPLGRPLGQAARAASLAAAAARFWAALRDGQVPPMAPGHCMWQYSRLMGCCRVPGERRDSWAPARPGRHAVVSALGQFYWLDVLDEAGAPRPAGALLREIEAAQRDAQRRPRDDVGSLTTAARPAWARARAALLGGAACNAVSLRAIESALFLVCLDEFEPAEGLTAQHRATMASPVTGGRFCDKPLSIVVWPDGRAGVTLEHSHLDGAPIAHAVEWMAASIAEGGDDLDGPLPLPTAAPVHRLRFELPAEVRTAIAAAQAATAERLRDFDVAVLSFGAHGSEVAKRAKVSPDAYFQLALQLAYYRTFGRVVPTYESVATTRFVHGRTETCRSCTAEALAFVRAPSREALLAAAQAHREYVRACAAGQGVDRHLLGLRVVAAGVGDGEPPALLADPLCAESSTFRLSTSQLRAAKSGHAVGFPPPAVPDGGVGVCYMVLPGEFRGSVTRSAAVAEREGVSAAAFVGAIEAALEEMRVLVEGGRSRL